MGAPACVLLRAARLWVVVAWSVAAGVLKVLEVLKVLHVLPFCRIEWSKNDHGNVSSDALVQN